MTVLTADDLGGRHSYLAEARPEFARSMAGIRNLGGPWECRNCNGVSYLLYRCSICGGDLTKGSESEGRH